MKKLSTIKTAGVPDKHQLRILKDTLKNPDKALLGGPSVEEAEQILRDKFKLSPDQINKLKNSTVEARMAPDKRGLKEIIEDFEALLKKYIGGKVQGGYRYGDMGNFPTISGEWLFQNGNVEVYFTCKPRSLDSGGDPIYMVYAGFSGDNGVKEQKYQIDANLWGKTKGLKDLSRYDQLEAMIKVVAKVTQV